MPRWIAPVRRREQSRGDLVPSDGEREKANVERLLRSRGVVARGSHELAGRGTDRVAVEGHARLRVVGDAGLIKRALLLDEPFEEALRLLGTEGSRRLHARR